MLIVTMTVDYSGFENLRLFFFIFLLTDVKHRVYGVNAVSLLVTLLKC